MGARREWADLPQLERLADTFRVPVAMFFFPEPPDLPPIEASFRTLGPAQFARIPPLIRLLLRKARAFQLGLEELNLGRNLARRLVTSGLSFQPSDDIDQSPPKCGNISAFPWNNSRAGAMRKPP